MDVCKQKEPELRPVSYEPEHTQRCFLDEETKAREVARLKETVMAETA